MVTADKIITRLDVPLHERVAIYMDDIPISCRVCDANKKLKVQKICVKMPDVYTLGMVKEVN